jgi:ABC-type nickel/cobalt efflux system permease component RcnA
VGTLTAAAVATSTGAFHIGLLATAYGFGFRHGIDWDHIAALTDITGSQSESRRSLFLATAYALGHGLVVFCLGLAAIALGEELPTSVNGVMERIVGVTLVVLGVYVFVALIRHGRDFRMRSRWMLVFGAVRRAARWARQRRDDEVVVTHDHPHDPGDRHPDGHDAVLAPAAGRATLVTEQRHGHRHRHVGTMPDDPFLTYAGPTAFGVGMIHGVGAETPTQILLFLAAASAGGTGEGVLLLCAFLVGLLSSNSLIALAGTFGFLGAAKNWKLYVGVSVVTAAFSLVVGTIFLLGSATLLPAFFGG